MINPNNGGSDIQPRTRRIAFFAGFGNTNPMSGTPGIDSLDMEELHKSKRSETQKALEALCDARRSALVQLQKIQILFKYLNWKQQEQINSQGRGSLEKINAITESLSLIEYSKNYSGEFSRIALVPAEKTRSSEIQRIKIMRKNILQFGIIQARAEELIGAIVKSAAVFSRQYKTACRELFPLGFISRLWRSARRLFNGSYFSWRDMGCLGNLGMTAVFVLAMAEAPVAGDRR
ncbi:MAG: hypothetical protein FWG27_02330 [Treponema sp.]|nr:hypothetical protein [Treponema sp.]